MLRRLYDWTMAKAAHPRAELWLAGICFAESSFFPIPPHPLLGIMCLAEPRKAVRFGLIATFASVIGGLFGYAIGYFVYDLVGAVIISGLGMTESFPQAACYLREYDVEVILLGGTTPIPFKLLTIAAGFIQMSLVPFILASIAGRGLVFMAVGVLFRVFGAPIKAVIDEHLGKVTALFGIAIVAGFIALAVLGGGAEESSEKCEAVSQV
jgi:membrane protein YqaA with SNARE-associated domain